MLGSKFKNRKNEYFLCDTSTEWKFQTLNYVRNYQNYYWDYYIEMGLKMGHNQKRSMSLF